MSLEDALNNSNRHLWVYDNILGLHKKVEQLTDQVAGLAFEVHALTDALDDLQEQVTEQQGEEYAAQ